jgi:hypothetical protein
VENIVEGIGMSHNDIRSVCEHVLSLDGIVRNAKDDAGMDQQQMENVQEEALQRLFVQSIQIHLFFFVFVVEKGKRGENWSMESQRRTFWQVRRSWLRWLIEG